MTLDKIFELWAIDAEIDPTDLGNESLKTAKLHHKYFQILSQERMLYRKYEGEMKVLRLEKHEFFSQGPSNETKDKGWKLPPIGRVLKSDTNNYIEADSDIQLLTLKMGVQLEKMDLLESIIKKIIARNFNIKSAIEWQKFINGVV